MTLKQLIATIGVLGLLAGCVYLYERGISPDSGSVNTVREDDGGGISVGPYGTKLDQLLVGSGVAATTLLPLEATSTDSFTVVAASTNSIARLTASYKCNVTIKNYDLAFGGLLVQGVTPGAGSLTFGIMNESGAATSSFPLATSSVSYVCWLPSTTF